MKKNVIETIVGLLVILIAISFFVFAYNISNKTRVSDGYNIYANFQNIEGITKGSDVKISGIKIGYVENIEIDPDTYDASVNLFIRNDISIPVDSRAIITTSGFIGSKYVNISPGGSEYYFLPGSRIAFTQSALNIEDLVSKLIYSLTK